MDHIIPGKTVPRETTQNQTKADQNIPGKPSPISRRSFVTTAAAGVAAIGAFGNMAPSARAQMVETKSHWNIAAFNRLVNHPARVKQLFDATAGNGSVFDHVHNSLNGLQFGFGIPQDQMQLVAIMRGMATILLFDDYIWKKYKFGVLANIKDPKTGKPAERNIYYPAKGGPDFKYASDSIESPYSLYADSSIQALQHRGLRLLGCHNATEFMARYIAEKNHLKQPHKKIVDDLLAHTLPNVLVTTAAVASIALLQTEGHYSYLYV